MSLGFYHSPPLKVKTSKQRPRSKRSERAERIQSRAKILNETEKLRNERNNAVASLTQLEALVEKLRQETSDVTKISEERRMVIQELHKRLTWIKTNTWKNCGSSWPCLDFLISKLLNLAVAKQLIECGQNSLTRRVKRKAIFKIDTNFGTNSSLTTFSVFLERRRNHWTFCEVFTLATKMLWMDNIHTLRKLMNIVWRGLNCCKTFFLKELYR